MKITFGIVAYENTDRISKIVDSIHREVSSCEIIIVGNKDVFKPSKKSIMTIIPFDETKKDGWITRKKNIISNVASNEIIVYMHDYVVLNKGWYDGLEKYCLRNESWNVLMNRIENIDGTRFRDWCVWDDPTINVHPWECTEVWCKGGHQAFKSKPFLPPYVYKKTKYMYVSGAYFVAKKEFMLQNPLDEKLVWGQGEDVEWSLRVRDKWDYKFNPYSVVSLLKQKPCTFPFINCIPAYD